MVVGTEQYIYTLGTIYTPFAKVCSIMQAKFDLYRTDFILKSMTFSALARYIDKGKVVPNLNRHLKLNLTRLKEAYQLIKSATTIGKLALGVDKPGEGAPFA
ncbi:hypothetical protein N7490_002138 [Penicillium lividum]|nr:hypothetical protein N7490_002138 [Penicillium lividum]